MRDGSIHTYLLKRLLAVFVLLSATICAFDYFYEFEKIDERVLRLALDESSHFMTDEVHLIREEDKAGLTANAHAHLNYSAFMVIEFYNADKKRLAEATHPGVEDIEREFNQLPHADLLSDSVKYQTLERQGRLYLRVASPLVHNGSLVGYFEGIYAVADTVLSGIKAQMAMSLVKIVVVIFMTTLALYPVILTLNRKVLDYAGELLDANIGTLESLGNAVAKRDSDTNEHNYRVTLYSIALAKQLGLEKAVLRELVKGAFLHDVGKIAISDNILLKPGKLTEEEFFVMKTHVTHGVEILRDYQWLREAVQVVEYHHEKFDGSGYSKGLKGRDIPETARIFSIVDVFDALTSKRPYKEAFSYEKSVAILREGSGLHFDPDILKAFEAISRELYDTLRLADEGALRAALRARIQEIFK
ncbi:MAG: HD-GYP domain-containing protein [Solidesulfovibrio sp.]